MALLYHDGIWLRLYAGFASSGAFLSSKQPIIAEAYFDELLRYCDAFHRKLKLKPCTFHCKSFLPPQTSFLPHFGSIESTKVEKYVKSWIWTFIQISKIWGKTESKGGKKLLISIIYILKITLQQKSSHYLKNSWKSIFFKSGFKNGFAVPWRYMAKCRFCFFSCIFELKKAHYGKDTCWRVFEMLRSFSSQIKAEAFTFYRKSFLPPPTSFLPCLQHWKYESRETCKIMNLDIHPNLKNIGQKQSPKGVKNF